MSSDEVFREGRFMKKRSQAQRECVTEGFSGPSYFILHHALIGQVSFVPRQGNNDARTGLSL